MSRYRIPNYRLRRCGTSDGGIPARVYGSADGFFGHTREVAAVRGRAHKWCVVIVSGRTLFFYHYLLFTIHEVDMSIQRNDWSLQRKGIIDQTVIKSASRKRLRNLGSIVSKKRSFCRTASARQSSNPCARRVQVSLRLQQRKLSGRATARLASAMSSRAKACPDKDSGGQACTMAAANITRRKST